MLNIEIDRERNMCRQNAEKEIKDSPLTLVTMVTSPMLLDFRRKFYAVLLA